jgi:hypothetical protein
MADIHDTIADLKNDLRALMVLFEQLPEVVALRKKAAAEAEAAAMAIHDKAAKQAAAEAKEAKVQAKAAPDAATRDHGRVRLGDAAPAF